jgi:transaldolase
MKMFVDTANLEELEETLKRGFPCGVTTNPSILSKEQRCDFRVHINHMIDLLRKYDFDIPLSVEVFTTDPREMIRQAEEFIGHFGHYPNLNVKVPVGWNELAVIAELRRRGIAVNCTCCMSYNQAVLAARAGANYVSLFWGRIRDIGYDAGSVVRQVHATFQQWSSPSEIIVGSIRRQWQTPAATLPLKKSA